MKMRVKWIVEKGKYWAANGWPADGHWMGISRNSSLFFYSEDPICPANDGVLFVNRLRDSIINILTEWNEDRNLDLLH